MPGYTKMKKGNSNRNKYVKYDAFAGKTGFQTTKRRKDRNCLGINQSKSKSKSNKEKNRQDEHARQRVKLMMIHKKDAFLKIPANTVCGDCRTAHPTEASLNTGALICQNRCAPLHNQMGFEVMFQVLKYFRLR